MQRRQKINSTKAYLSACLLLYVAAIAIGAEHYLPYQAYAPGIFKEYSLNAFRLITLPLITMVGAAFFPKRIELPSDWFSVIFIIFLLIPGLTLGITSDTLPVEKKIVILPTLIISIFILTLIKRLPIRIAQGNSGNHIKSNILYMAFTGWLILAIFLIAKYHDVMRFSDPATLYEQRALTADVGGLWGYIQLYFTFVFSTLLAAYGLTRKRWLWFFLGSTGYIMMFMITAERSQLIFPAFFLAINFLTKTQRDSITWISNAIITFAALIFGATFFSEEIPLFDSLGFYLFSRLIATPSQFILDYYEFFSTNGYTFFSQIKGFDILIPPPCNI